MKIGEIDYNLKEPKRSLFLCKPNKSTIAKINEAYDIQYYTKLGTVNELSFKIPTIIFKDDVPMENPNIVRIKNRYLFKFVIGKVTEYFLFNDGTKVYGDDEYIEYRAFSLGSQLSDKNVREFKHIGYLHEVVSKLLDNIYGEDIHLVRWRVNPQDVDSYFTTNDFGKREYEVSSMSALEIIYDIATKWNAVIRWNTVDQTIGFYKAENVGLNKGFYIRDGKYLENFNLQIDTSSTVTRIKAFGAEGVDLAKINPTGQFHIEDFSFYMYPFEYDEAKNKILKSSDYMSDELCVSLYKYQKLLKSNSDAFNLHVSTIQTLTDIMRSELRTLAEIQTEVTLLENKRDLLLAEFQESKGAWGTNGFNDRGTKDGTQEHAEILAELAEARARLSTQVTAVDNANMYLKDAENDKENYIASLNHTLHFSPSEWSELQQFIIEKEYTNESITDELELLEEAKTVLRQNQEPAIRLTVSIIDFLSVVECQNDWDKLGLGDTIRIRYDRLKVNLQAKIIEINYDFENFTISLTIANEQDLKDGTDKLMDLLNKADITSTIVQMDKNGWNLSKENNGKINDLINNKWDALKQAVLAGYDQQISISERGIIVKSLEDPNSWLVIQNGFLAITNDAGNTWKHAISKDGIWGEYIFGKVISGVNLLIEDESGVWKTQGSRTTIYDRNGNETMWLGLVSDNSRDQFDNIIKGDAECFGLKSWNSHTKVEMSTCVGIAISRWKDDDWQKVFWADGSGTLYTQDLVAKGIKIRDNFDELILDAENNYFNIGLFENIIADGSLTSLEKLQIATELHQIHTDYKNTLAQAEKYNRSNSDITYDLEAQWFEGQGFPVESVDQISHCDPTALIKAYTDLMNYISQYIPIINKGIQKNETFEIDHNDPLMERTSKIENRGYFIQVFRDYHDESIRLKQAIEDSLFYSGINMGHYYNNLMMGKQGFVAVRSDGKYRAYLNATNGLVLEKWEVNRWVKKLYGAIGDPNWEDGTLIAEGLVTKNLRIVDAHMNEKIIFDWYDGITIFGDNATIYLNANDAIKITDLSGDKKFWVDMDGSLFAKDMTTHNLKIVDGNLGEKIIFDHNDGITINGNNGEQIRLNANEGIAIDVDGDKRFWVGTDGFLYAKKLYIQGDDDEVYEDIDGSYISDLTVSSLKTLGVNKDRKDIVHISENFLRFKTSTGSTTEQTKLDISFSGSGINSYPVMTFGAGNGNAYGSGSEQAKIYKDGTKFAIEYDSPYSGGQMTRFIFNETDTDDEGQAVYFESKGGIRFHSDKKFVAKADLEQYMRVVKNEDVTLKYKDSLIRINDEGIELRGNTSNYIKITSSGVEIKGTRIDLN